MPPSTSVVVIDGVAAFAIPISFVATSLLEYPLVTAIALTVADADVTVNAPLYFVLDALGAEPSVV